MKPNLLLDFEQVLLPLRGCDTGETLFDDGKQTPNLQVCRPEQPPAQIALHGIWQLTRDDRSLCTYIGGKNRDGEMLRHLRHIEGQRIEQIRFLPAKRHLFLQFSNHINLRIFSSPLRPESYRLIVPEMVTSPASRRGGCLMTCYGAHLGGLARVTWWE